MFIYCLNQAIEICWWYLVGTRNYYLSILYIYLMIPSSVKSGYLRKNLYKVSSNLESKAYFFINCSQLISFSLWLLSFPFTTGLTKVTTVFLTTEFYILYFCSLWLFILIFATLFDILIDLNGNAIVFYFYFYLYFYFYRSFILLLFFSFSLFRLMSAFSPIRLVKWESKLSSH